MQKIYLLTVKAVIIKHNVNSTTATQTTLFFLLPAKSVNISRLSLLDPPASKNLFLYFKGKCNCWLFLKRTSNKCAQTHSALPHYKQKSVFHDAFFHSARFSQHICMTCVFFFFHFSLSLRAFFIIRFSDYSTKEL